jgi:hypothetical protein
MAKYKVVITDYEYDSLKLEQGILSGLDVEFITAQCRTEDEVIRRGCRCGRDTKSICSDKQAGH